VIAGQRDTGNGTSTADQWEINSTVLFTTSVSKGGLHVGAIGEGYQYTNADGYTFTNPSTSRSLLVALNVAAGLITAVVVDVEIVWCLTPIAALSTSTASRARA
jgi:hypothetical protein